MWNAVHLGVHHDGHGRGLTFRTFADLQGRSVAGVHAAEGQGEGRVGEVIAEQGALHVQDVVAGHAYRVEGVVDRVGLAVEDGDLGSAVELVHGQAAHETSCSSVTLAFILRRRRRDHAMGLDQSCAGTCWVMGMPVCGIEAHHLLVGVDVPALVVEAETHVATPGDVVAGGLDLHLGQPGVQVLDVLGRARELPAASSLSAPRSGAAA